MTPHAGPTQTCPWWLTPVFDNRLRRLIQPPESVLRLVAWPGGRLLDVGCGMGYLTVPAARLVGPEGRVHAVDLQRQSLEALVRRARRAGVEDRVSVHCADATDLRLPAPADAACAMWSLHEVASLDRLAGRLVWLLCSGAPLLVAEPRLHVSDRRFEQIVATFEKEGFSHNHRVKVRLSRAAVLLAP